MGSVNLIHIALSMTAFIFAAAIHEFSHGWAAYRLGDDTAKLSNRLTLNPLRHIDPFGTLLLPLISAFTHVPVIGWMIPVPVNSNRFKNPSKGMAIVSFWGPYSNWLQAMVAFTLFTFLPKLLPVPWQTHRLFLLFSQGLNLYYEINLFLMFFNLLPIPPLDGGWILRYFLPLKARSGFDRFYPYAALLMFLIILFSRPFSLLLHLLTQLIVAPLLLLTAVHFSLSLIPLALSFIPMVILTVTTSRPNASTVSASTAKRPTQPKKKAPSLSPFPSSGSQTPSRALPSAAPHAESLSDTPAKGRANLPPSFSAENQQAVPLLLKLKTRRPLTDTERNALLQATAAFSLRPPIPPALLCASIDFLPEDAYCQNCSYFHSCALQLCNTALPPSRSPSPPGLPSETSEKQI